MSEEQAQNLPDGRSFEERVFARFDTLDARFDNMEARIEGMDGRLQVLERKAYDTKPIWEQALKEIAEVRREMVRRLDRIESVVLETRSRLGEAEDRLDKLESTRAQS